MGPVICAKLSRSYHAHNVNGYPQRRQGQGRGQVDGLIWQDVERVCVYAEIEGKTAGLRGAAMIRLMSDWLLRISEVVVVNLGDLKDKTLTLRASKTDQEGIGESLYVCDNTQQLLKRYLERAGITRGAVFRHIRRGGHVQSDRLTTVSARRIIKKRLLMLAWKGSSPGIHPASGLLSRSHKPASRHGVPYPVCPSCRVWDVADKCLLGVVSVCRSCIPTGQRWRVKSAALTVSIRPTQLFRGNSSLDTRETIVE